MPILMMIADVHSNLRHRDVVTLLLLNGYHFGDLLACGLLGYHLEDLKVGHTVYKSAANVAGCQVRVDFVHSTSNEET